jgi:cytochrome c-type protein NapB
MNEPGPMEADMRKVILTVIMSATLMASYVIAQADVQSLRGDNELDAMAKGIEKKKLIAQKGGFERSWQLQPPSIPHTIEKDRITLRENTCMKCHSKENHEKEKAPEIGESHYIDRDGNVLKKPSSRRYFCDQCHTPQADVAPLVENTF